MTEPWECKECRAQVAPGAPRCPECPSTEFTKPEAEDEMVLKIAADGSVSDSVAAAGASPVSEDDTSPGESDASARTSGDGSELPPPPPASAPKAEHVAYAAEVLEVPADEAEAMRKADLVQLARDAVAEAAPEPQAPVAAPGPARAPVLPPSRTAPPGQADG